MSNKSTAWSRYCIIAGRRNIPQEDDLIRTHVDTMDGVQNYCRGFEDGIRAGDSYFIVWVDRGTSRWFRHRETKPEGRASIQSPWGRLVRVPDIWRTDAGTEAALIVLRDGDQEIQHILTDRQMRDAQDVDAERYILNSELAPLSPFRAVPSVIAAWLWTVRSGDGSGNRVAAFIEAKKSEWGWDVMEVLLHNPETVMTCLGHDGFRQYVLANSFIAAEVVKLCPDLRDRRLELSAAGLTNVDAMEKEPSR